MTVLSEYYSFNESENLIKQSCLRPMPLCMRSATANTKTDAKWRYLEKFAVSGRCSYYGLDAWACVCQI
jgi:hypothetical protein